jgi:peptide/nickel transport system ATP-binding protein
MSEPLLEVENLTIQYETTEGPLGAVSDVSFTIDDGEYFGLVGESGCGKSTVVDALIGSLDDNGRVASGTIKFRGEEIQDYTERQWNRNVRWKEISLIPQSSMNSLDPLKRIDKHALELAQVHTDMDEDEALGKFQELFETVGLHPDRISDYPHQFSGGMQQRVIIALALFLDPSLIIADEPTTALDVIMQDQIFEFLEQIQTEFDRSMLLITHDISVVFESCENMGVMHAGQMVERGSVTDVFDEPRHPYAILLQEAFPDIRDPKQELKTIDGAPPKNIGEVNECTFADRCPWAIDDCYAAAPPLESVAQGTDHRAGCIRWEEVHDLYKQRPQID